MTQQISIKMMKIQSLQKCKIREFDNLNGTENFRNIRNKEQFQNDDIHPEDRNYYIDSTHFKNRKSINIEEEVDDSFLKKFK